jgi:PKD repeat protein
LINLNRKKLEMKKAILLILFAALVFSSCKKTPTAVAQFSYTLDNSALGLVHFTNSSTDASSYYWDFGDGSTSTEASPDHYFPVNKTFYASLKPYNSDDEAGTSAYNSVVVTNGPYCTALMLGSNTWNYAANKYAYATKSSNLITVYTEQNTDDLWFSLPLDATVGTYDISSNPSESFSYDGESCSPYVGIQAASSSLSCSSGSVTITGISQTEISGTFTCYVVTSCNSGYTWLNITNGQFAVRFK